MMTAPYDTFEPLTPNRWINNKKWLVNRALFLIYLKAVNYERFISNAGETYEEVKENMKLSLEPEHEELRAKHPNQFNEAKAIFEYNFFADEIPYVGEDHGKTTVH